MRDTAVRAEHLAKRYSISQSDRNVLLWGKNTLRDKLAGLIHHPFRRFRHSKSVNGLPENRDERPDHIWALKDVSLEVKRGEVVGFIGHNGAGKSTLLKILSRITEPSRGSADIYGRLGCLLEVGTGFHSELTGRENIYLSGAILGMKKAEIDRKLEEIIGFSEVERFIDTPLKYYSSGMSVRLAFSVAAHLEPEIVVIDEVLAVGDAAFQKKCLEKMDRIAREGRTILFVSHDMSAVESLCSRVVWLKDGRIEREGRSTEVIPSYLQTTFPTVTERAWNDRSAAPGHDRFRLRRVRVRPVSGSPSDSITPRTAFVIEFEYWNMKGDSYQEITFKLYNEQGILVFKTGPVEELGRCPLMAGLFRDTCHVPGSLLREGMYRVTLEASTDTGVQTHLERDTLIFHIQNERRAGGMEHSKPEGVIGPNLKWDRKNIGVDEASGSKRRFFSSAVPRAGQGPRGVIPAPRCGLRTLTRTRSFGGRAALLYQRACTVPIGFSAVDGGYNCPTFLAASFKGQLEWTETIG